MIEYKMNSSDLCYMILFTSIKKKICSIKNKNKKTIHETREKRLLIALNTRIDDKRMCLLRNKRVRY